MKFFVLLLASMLISTNAMNNSDYKVYEDINYSEAWETLKLLERTYPSLVTIRKAEDIYGKKYPGKLFNDSKLMCGEKRCETPIVRLTVKENITQEVTRKPQVLLLGGFGGENTEGTAAIITYISMLCRYYERIPTLTHILKTRDLWLLPFPNSWGLYHRNDTELGIDPIFDFPYKVGNGGCFRTKTARIINELVSENLFQIVINFRYGSPAIGFSWGSYNHTPCGGVNQDICDLDSPDVISQSAIAEAMSDAAGDNDLNDSVTYGVRYMKGRRRNTLRNNKPGAFEDWIYAASWDHASIPQRCFADNEYPSKLQSDHPSFTKRASSFSIEIEKFRITYRMQIDYTFEDILQKHTFDPPVSRSIRAIHKAVELVKPEIIHQNKPILTSHSPTSARLKTQLLPIGCLHIDYLVAVVKEGAKCEGDSHRVPIFNSPRKCRSISPWDNWNFTESQEWQLSQSDVIDLDITIPTKDHAACIYFEYSFDSDWNRKSHSNAAVDPLSLLVLARSSYDLNVTTSNAKLVRQSHMQMEQGAIYYAKYCHTNADGNVLVSDGVKAHTEDAARQSFAPGTFSLELKLAPVCVVRETDTN
ncbi:uncharacterized protein LOC128882083 isoform X2 [Hylaeus volcanicus]|uniref:uncharacterized protein LOC128882083 isoform X2 n=1 Tax=Hylaeus volcanicus TaxID=313075 RepID=UPI0023B81F61|nr:uncharacterized protein LOC128882083 isoform X2 [Hylaeus volcanicus]